MLIPTARCRLSFGFYYETLMCTVRQIGPADTVSCIAYRVVKTVTFLAFQQLMKVSIADFSPVLSTKFLAFVFSASFKRKCFIFEICIQVESAFHISNFISVINFCLAVLVP